MASVGSRTVTAGSELHRPRDARVFLVLAPPVCHAIKTARAPADARSMSEPWDGTHARLPFDATAEQHAARERPETGPNGFVIAPPLAVGVAKHHGSRWTGDSVTLSRWWRLVATVLLLGPAVWMFFFMGIAGIIFFALYVFTFLPVALRDVWRRTRVSSPVGPSRRRSP